MTAIRRAALAWAVVSLCAAPVAAQPATVIAPELSTLADGKTAHVYNRLLTVGAEDGRAFARVDARAGDGGVLLNGIQMSDGIIEVDLKGKDVAQQSFLGIAFHVVDWTTLDAVYFRPFNFRGADAERRSHSVQYVAHPAYPWQRLRAERPGQFENAIDPPPDPNAWFHARMVVAGGRVEVFVNGAAKPSLSVEDLGPVKSGGVALFVGNGSDGVFANLTITPTAPPGPPPASMQTIFQAAATGNLARVRALVAADPKTVAARAPNGLTPLHAASLYGQQATAEFLVSRGADLNAVARHSGTPMDVAFEAKQEPMVAWLQSRGARFTPLRFEVTTITPAVRRMAFPWGMMNNVLAYTGSDGAIVVDSGFSTRAVDELKTTIVGRSKAGVRYVINTHEHSDHVAGNAIAPSPQAVITSATLTAAAPGLPITRGAEPLKGRTGRTLPAPFTLRTGGADIMLIPRPGLHSDADVIVWFPGESVVAMGDLLLSETIPATADIEAYLSFLEDVLDVFPEKTTFVSGHGHDLDAAGVRAYRDSLLAMVGIIRANVAAGRTADQMAQDDVLKAYKAKLGLLDFLPVDALIPRVVAATRQGTLK